ncbi:nucleotidyltransferase domain-containing protein [Promicromonospora sp. Populi]|uniref:nucleotidyltransferase domain-containing protein n=1 Tax=Promicromonospora sp. Populi TaxID=3239420 RepID=UPI0034E22FC8
MSQTVPIFRSALQESVLRAIFRSDRPLSSAEIARATGEPTSSVSREVRALTKAGVLTTRQAGRRSLVSFDESSPVVPGLRMMLSATTRHGFRPRSRLGWAVAAHRKELVALAGRYGLLHPRLFGSVARGDDGPDSDIDILVDVAHGRGLGDLAAFVVAATDLLGAKVDVADAGALIPDVVREAAREAVPL